MAGQSTIEYQEEMFMRTLASIKQLAIALTRILIHALLIAAVVLGGIATPPERAAKAHAESDRTWTTATEAPVYANFVVKSSYHFTDEQRDIHATALVNGRLTFTYDDAAHATTIRGRLFANYVENYRAKLGRCQTLARQTAIIDSHRHTSFAVTVPGHVIETVVQNGASYVLGNFVLSVIGNAAYRHRESGEVIDECDPWKNHTFQNEGDDWDYSFIVIHPDLIPVVDPDTGLYYYAGTVEDPPGEGWSSWWITLSNVPCAGGAYIDGQSTNLRDLQVTLSDTSPILPHESAELTATVTNCAGQPIKNADLKISVRPQAHSGGHYHAGQIDDDDRPRGYLAGVKITKDNPAIIRRTGADGRVVIPFTPGKDTRLESIGIAGDYEITVESVRFPQRTAKSRVRVGYQDFVEVTDGQHLRVVGDTGAHPDNTWADRWTAQRLPVLAATWREVAETYRAQNTCADDVAPLIWPPYLLVNDISLINGGLFDVIGWDAQAGRVRGAEWQPPHYTHTDGRVVDFSLRNVPACLAAPLRADLIQIGRGFGSWIGGHATLTLRMNGALPRKPQPTSAGADLGVVAFRSDRDTPAVAAGQIVTYAVGVNNLDGIDPAQGVLLTATLPNGLNFLSADPDPMGITARQVTWNIDALPALTRTRLITLVAQIAPTMTVGSVLTLTANAGLNGIDVDLTDNYDAVALRVQPAAPDLVIDSELDGAVFEAGQLLTATIDVANYGALAAPNTQLTLTLPASVTLVSANPITSAASLDNAVWSLGVLAPDAIKTVTVTLRPQAGLAVHHTANLGTGWPLTFTLNANSSAIDLYPDTNQQTVVAPLRRSGHDTVAWLNMTGDQAGSITAGQNLTLTLYYANYGERIAPATALTLTLANGLNVVSTQPAAQRLISGTTAGWDLGTLSPGEQGVRLVNVHVNGLLPEGSFAAVNINASAYDFNIENNFALKEFPGAVFVGAYRLSLPLVRR